MSVVATSSYLWIFSRNLSSIGMNLFIADLLGLIHDCLRLLIGLVWPLSLWLVDGRVWWPLRVVVERGDRMDANMN